MSVKEILVPDIGDFSGVEVIEVLVAVGDTIAAEDSLLTLETDKASMEVPSTAAGVVKELKVKVGDKVSQGSVILTIEAEGGAAQASEPTESAAPAPASAQPTPAATAASSAASTATAATPSSVSLGGRVYASPSVRKLARLGNVDLKTVPGTGNKGRITKSDIENFLKGGAPAAQAAGKVAAAAGMAGIPPIPPMDFSKFGEVEEVALGRIQKVSGPHLHRAWLNMPMVTFHDEADITDMEAFRKSIGPEAEKLGYKVSPLMFIIKALTASLQAFPRFNSSLSADGQSLVMKKYYNIGIAVDTPNGLVVPVIKDTDKKSIYQLCADMAEISKKARDGKLGPNDMSGGCITISSLGGIGGTAFTPIVNAPEVAILGVTRSYMKPVWDGAEFKPRLVCPFDLTFDHKVIDGAEAARFVTHMCKNLADMKRLLL